MVCGGAGFLGALFVKYFLFLNHFKFKNKCRIISLDNFLGRERKDVIEDDTLINLHHDLTSSYLSLKLYKEKIDFIINCSGCASPYYYERYPLETMDVSTEGTKNLLQTALSNNAKILQAG